MLGVRTVLSRWLCGQVRDFLLDIEDLPFSTNVIDITSGLDWNIVLASGGGMNPHQSAGADLQSPRTNFGPSTAS
jgi:hypothetical protein